ncbi:OLC1v1003181C1 [Oldenlandia corymbosa var. corymbosa]|uniref:OLC1v1003181C1 n=1 Tax=Oldenlandia corymbosa var. corymbosa TaxID=529605 RepID=A0AAV1DBU3_OLDCO|nr:OLC1v1003181C1 [Oldenlandia corymbosa var. corymbosa]
MELITFVACFLLFLIMAAKSMRKPKNLPPGPRPLPIIGNLHQVHGALPHRILRDFAKKYGPLMYLKLGEVPTVVVSSPEMAKLVMMDHDIVFASRPYLLFGDILNYNCQDIAFSPYSDSWRQLRKICNMELLSSKRVGTLRPIREEEVMNVMKTVASRIGETINLTKMIYSETYSVIARSAFGKKTKYHDEYIALMEEVIKLMGGLSIVDLYPSVKILERITGLRSKLEAIQKKVDEVLESVINEHKLRRAQPKQDGVEEEKEDLVDVLLNVQNSQEFRGTLTSNNIKGAIYDVFSAGGETSSKTSIWALCEMIKNPTLLQRAQEEVRRVYGPKGNVDESQLHELKFLRAVIKEALRFRPSAPLTLPRESREDCEIGGYFIPAKTRVIVNAFAVCRDPNHWVEPDVFNPDRFLESNIDFQGKDFSYIPFGAGRRICPGIAFALPNMELPLAHLLFHFDWKLPGEMGPQDLNLTEVFGLTVGPKEDLCLVPTSIYHKSILA